jgi:translation initiation factor 1A
MPKNKIGGKKHKGKKNDVKVAKTLEIPESEETIGQVIKVKGNGRFDVRCIDGVSRSGILRGTMRKRVWVNRLDLLLVEPWSFETDKCSILHKYDDDEFEKLKNFGHIPNEFKLESDECNPDDDDDYFSYDISDSDTEMDENPVVSDEKIVENDTSSTYHRTHKGMEEIDIDDI